MHDTPPKVGLLTMAATHLGDPRDIPSRSLDALQRANLLIFEEDRPARSFLKAAGVTREYLKYSEHNQELTMAEIERVLLAGEWVCYMSDQGTPSLSDPGRELVQLAYDLGAKVQVIPGPSALSAAVSACPFDCFGFHFLGLPPRQPDKRKAALQDAGRGRRPLIMMDTPYRLKHLLQSCADAFGSSRRGFLALDMTGPGEAFWLGEFKDLAKRAGSLDGTQNFVLIIEPGPDQGEGFGEGAGGSGAKRGTRPTRKR